MLHHLVLSSPFSRLFHMQNWSQWPNVIYEWSFIWCFELFRELCRIGIPAFMWDMFPDTWRWHLPLCLPSVLLCVPPKYMWISDALFSACFLWKHINSLKKSTNSIGQIENVHIFEVSHFFKVTKQLLSDDKGKYCTSPVVVCWMPEVSGRLLAWQPQTHINSKKKIFNLCFTFCFVCSNLNLEFILIHRWRWWTTSCFPSPQRKEIWSQVPLRLWPWPTTTPWPAQTVCLFSWRLRVDVRSWSVIQANAGGRWTVVVSCPAMWCSALFTFPGCLFHVYNSDDYGFFVLLLYLFDKKVSSIFISFCTW